MVLEPDPATDPDDVERLGRQLRNELRELDVDEVSAADRPWVTVVWNDPVNLMSYVTHVFREYFGLARADAERRLGVTRRPGRGGGLPRLGGVGVCLGRFHRR